MHTRLAAALLALAVTPAFAQPYPAKAVRWISPFAPGGGADITSRAIGVKLADYWGQQVVIDNRGGAGGNIGTELAAKSPADGYTILLGTVGAMAVNPSLFQKLAFDPVKDFVAVTQAAEALNALVVHPSLPVKNVREFVALAKRRPGELHYGSSGVGATDHLSGELFDRMTGTKMSHVPYKGGAPAMLDLMGGNLQLIFATIATSVGNIKAGKIRALALTGKTKYELMPELPLISQTVPGFEATNWYGVFLPAGTPKPVVDKVYADVVRALQDAETKKRLLDSGIVAIWSAPDQFLAFQRAEIQKWAKLIKEANIRVE